MSSRKSRAEVALGKKSTRDIGAGSSTATVIPREKPLKVSQLTSSTQMVAGNVYVDPRQDTHPHHHHHHHHHHRHLIQNNFENHVFAFKEQIREACTILDAFAAAHNIPVHVFCIVVSSAIIPTAAICIVWDLIAAIVFQIPNLSTINAPGFMLFISFIAIPLAMYGYMMEYLMHENSRLTVIALLGVVVHPILFLIRAGMEYLFDGFRGEEKIYFEGFEAEGQEAKYPIGIVRYRQGVPYSDSEEGKESIKRLLSEHYRTHHSS